MSQFVSRASRPSSAARMASSAVFAPLGIGKELDVRAVKGSYEVIAVGMLELDTLESEGDEFGPRGFDSTSHEGGGGKLPRTEEESRMEGLVCYGKHSGQVY